MKTRTFMAIATLIALITPGGIQAQTVDPAITTVECSTKPYFSDNQCQVCYDGGEITPDAKGVTLTAQELPWENTLDGINQNFYETSQGIAEIKTNIGTAPSPWDETGLDWGTDVVWKDLDGLNLYSLDAGKTITIKTIKDKTAIPLSSMKQDANPYFMLKIPISYYELKMGTFAESAKKTTTYCVAYTPKKVAGATTPATPPASTPAPATPPATTPASNTGTNNPSPAPSTIKDTTKTEESTTVIDDEIPTYNAKVSLNSAGADPTVVAATRVATGPAENIFMIAALLLGLILLPRVNKIFNQ